MLAVGVALSEVTSDNRRGAERLGIRSPLTDVCLESKAEFDRSKIVSPLLVSENSGPEPPRASERIYREVQPLQAGGDVEQSLGKGGRCLSCVRRSETFVQIPSIAAGTAPALRPCELAELCGGGCDRTDDYDGKSPTSKRSVVTVERLTARFRIEGMPTRMSECSVRRTTTLWAACWRQSIRRLRVRCLLRRPTASWYLLQILPASHHAD